MEAADQVNLYIVQLTEVNVPSIHMMCTSLLELSLNVDGSSEVSVERTCSVASRELLMEMKVATLYCFVGGNSIQIGAVDNSEASFFPNIKYANCVVSPSVHIAIIESFGR